MKRLFGGLMASGLMLAVAAAPAVAQKKDIKMRGYFGVGGGVGLPLGVTGDDFKLGWLANAIGGFTTKGGIVGARADVMWAQNGFKGGTDGHLRLVGLNVDLVLTPGHRPSKVHPYFLAGAGFYNGQATGTGVNSESTSKPAFNAGVGVQIHTGHRMDLFLEGRFLSVLTEGSSTNLIPIVFGLRWGGI